MMREEDRLLAAKIEDKARQCADRGMLTHTAFLDLHQRSVAAGLPLPVRPLFYGGFAEAERTVAVFAPDYIDAPDPAALAAYFDAVPQEDPVRILRVEKDRFSPALTHRDYLGALMALGIRREMTGDILVDAAGCRIAVLASMADFLTENLTAAGRATLTVTIEPPGASRAGLTAAGVPDSFTVSSLRLDSLVKNGFGVSRPAACAAITQGLVFVNDLECLKADRRVGAGDKITFRHRGRIRITACGGRSKKGRVIVEIERFR
ncbi:MAG: hypothetical protein IJK64_09065 [Clostridia bacterium]|nr:hypothetical protein [Clostridia bacterium]